MPTDGLWIRGKFMVPAFISQIHCLGKLRKNILPLFLRDIAKDFTLFKRKLIYLQHIAISLSVFPFFHLDFLLISFWF